MGEDDRPILAWQSRLDDPRPWANAWSGALTVGWVRRTDPGSLQWVWRLTVGHEGEEGPDGVAESFDDATWAVETAWREWICQAGLTPLAGEQRAPGAQQLELELG